MGIATGLLFQGLVLLPPGIKVIQYLDNYLLEQFIKIKKEVN